MPVLSGRVPVSGMGVARVPIRVETPDGVVAGLTTAGQDGSWSVEVPAGDYVVCPRGFEPYEASVAASQGQSSTANPDPVPETLPVSMDGAAFADAFARRRQQREGDV